jgi:hypothetical protein
MRAGNTRNISPLPTSVAEKLFLRFQDNTRSCHVFLEVAEWRVARSRNLPVVTREHVTQKGAKTTSDRLILNVPNDKPTSTLNIWRAIEPPQHTMFPQRSMMRASQRFASQIRSPAVRTPFQRRFASSESSAFKGAEDNAFNRERHAVKEHAVGTTGA